MGEYEYYTAPKPWTMHRCHVYQFGVLWFWKCEKPNCHGGRARSQQGAMDGALDHVKTQPWGGRNGATITYEQALAECSDLEYLGHA